jgi:uncharacterized protein (TIGR03067 family)
MRVNRIVCPKCQATLTSKAGVEVGTSIACPKCKQKFSVAAPPEEEEVVDDFDIVDDDEDEAPKKKPLKPAPKKPVKAVEDEEEEDRPKAKRRPPVKENEDEEEEKVKRQRRQEEDEDEEEERPKAKKGKRDENDDDRPRKKKKKRRRDDEELSAYDKLKANIWVRVSVLGVLFAVLGVVIWLRFIKDKKEVPSETVETSQPEKTDRPAPKLVAKQPVNHKERFQGVWSAVTATRGGVIAPPEALEKFRFTVKDDQFIPQENPDDVAKFTLDPSKDPPEIDLVDKKNQTDRGIYRFRPDGTLVLCFNTMDGGERPKTFVAPQGSQIMLMVLKRETQ